MDFDGSKPSSCSSETNESPPSLVTWSAAEPIISSPNTENRLRTISFLVLGAAEPPLVEESASELTPSPIDAEKTSSAPSPAQPSWTSKVLMLLCSACILLLMGMLGPVIAERMQRAITRGKLTAEYENAGYELAKGNNGLSELSKACQLVSHRIGPSVVHINTVERNSQADVIESAFERQSQGQGSGVIIDAKGYIITNYHVVRGARKILVGLSDDRAVEGEVLAFDSPTDIAVLKIKADNLVAADWGNSDDLDIGSLVWAAGSPYGLDHSVTFGILSGKNRGGLAGTAHQDFLQTDVAVNPGNSGGPLVDSRGRVVGINTAIVGQSYQGISFAIPSNVVKQIYTNLLSKGRVDRGWLGVRVDPVPRDVATAQGLATPRGAIVTSLTSEYGHESPAEAAGVKVGDIITSWDSREVAGPAQIIQFVSSALAGSNVKLGIMRNGARQEITVLIGARPRELN